MNKLPDYCAGALASWDFTADAFDKEKSMHVLSAIVHNSINILLSTEHSDNKISFKAARIGLNVVEANQ